MPFSRSKHEQFDLTTRFDVLDKIKTAGGMILTVATDNGPKTLNVPKWINVYHWSKNGQKKCEAWIPDWLCQKAGLI